MAKLPIFLLLIGISAVLAGRENETFSETCLKVAKDQNDRGGKAPNSVLNRRRGLMGGWEKVDMDTLDDHTAEVLAGLTELAIVRENMQANDRVTYDVSQRVEDMEVYGQVVNGMNYCIQFEAKPRNGNGPVKECVAEAYASFGFLYHSIPEQPSVKVKCGVK